MRVAAIAGIETTDTWPADIAHKQYLPTRRPAHVVPGSGRIDAWSMPDLVVVAGRRFSGALVVVLDTTFDPYKLHVDSRRRSGRPTAVSIDLVLLDAVRGLVARNTLFAYLDVAEG